MKPAVKRLSEMKDRGISLLKRGSVIDDCSILKTDDPAVAKAYSFSQVTWDTPSGAENKGATPLGLTSSVLPDGKATTDPDPDDEEPQDGRDHGTHHAGLYRHLALAARRDAIHRRRAPGTSGRTSFLGRPVPVAQQDRVDHQPGLERTGTCGTRYNTPCSAARG